MRGMSGKSAKRNELGEFLKARRSELSLQAVGLPDSRSVRRVPGLRREEVAQLAAISPDYYARLEQGRLQASATVLTTLARVLRLDDDQRAYLLGLAGKSTDRPRKRTTQQVRPQLRRLLDQLTESPALILGRYTDILAWNPLAAALITEFSEIPEHQRNFVRLAFTDPRTRGMMRDWEDVARTCVAFLRMEAAHNPEDPRLTALVGELCVRDPDFRSWWAEHDVATMISGTKRYRHPVVGDLTLDWDVLSHTADQQLLVMTAEPGTPSHDALRLLASWAAGPPTRHTPETSG